MSILICDPEGSSRGGMSVALDCLFQSCFSASMSVYRLQKTGRSYCVIDASSQTTYTGSLINCLEAVSTRLLIAVGWHTWSEHAARVASSRRIRVVFWSHGVGCAVFYKSKPLLGCVRFVTQIFKLAGVARVLSTVDLLVTAYPRASFCDVRSFDELIAKWVGCETRVIPNPVDLSVWQPCSDHCTSQTNIRVAVVGRLEWQKNQLESLRILSESGASKPEILCMAPKRTPYAGKLVDVSKKRKYRSIRLSLKTGLDPGSRSGLLACCFLSINWSETEYQSLAILESLACGVPVIARPSGWLLSRTIPGILQTKSPSQASQWLKRLGEKPALAKRIGLAGLRYVQDVHSVNSATKKWQDIIEEVVNA